MIGTTDRSRNQPHAPQIDHHLTPPVDLDAELRRDLGLRRIALQRGRELPRSCLYLLMTPPQIARCPVQLPQTIENRSLDPVLGIARKGDLLGRIVLRRSIEQPQYPRMDQVIKIHVYRQVLVYANGNRLHQRQMLEYDAIANRVLCSLTGSTLCLFHVGHLPWESSPTGRAF